VSLDYVFSMASAGEIEDGKSLTLALYLALIRHKLQDLL